MKLFSKIAYHSSPHDLESFESKVPEDKAKTGEGAMIHGWGLYLQGDKQINTERYKDRLSGIPLIDFGNGWVSAKDLSVGTFAEKNPEEFNRIWYAWEIISNIWATSREQGYSVGLLMRDGVEKFKEHMNSWIDVELESKRHEELNRGVPLDVFEAQIARYRNSVDLVKDIKMNAVNQYTVEIPDDMVFAEEGLEGENQPELVKSILYDELMKEWYSEEYVRSLMEEDLPFIIYKLKPEFDDDSKEQAEYLMSLGIDGIHYNGGRDGECWVVFNCEKVKIIAKE